MLAAGVVVHAVVYVYLVELIAIAQGPTRYVYQLASVIVDAEDNAVAGVGQHAVHLVLVDVQELEVTVEQQPVRLEIDGRLTTALVAERPVRIDEAPERRP